jgi:LPXTG-motif cell wall-anchored protein
MRTLLGSQTYLQWRLARSLSAPCCVALLIARHETAKSPFSPHPYQADVHHFKADSIIAWLQPKQYVAGSSRDTGENSNNAALLAGAVGVGILAVGLIALRGTQPNSAGGCDCSSLSSPQVAW